MRVEETVAKRGEVTFPNQIAKSYNKRKTNIKIVNRKHAKPKR